LLNQAVIVFSPLAAGIAQNRRALGGVRMFCDLLKEKLRLSIITAIKHNYINILCFNLGAADRNCSVTMGQ
jgi:hypothetical protein